MALDFQAPFLRSKPIDDGTGLFTPVWQRWLVQLAAAMFTVPNGTQQPTAQGRPGQVSYDADYLYVCVGVNQWKRVALIAF